MKYSILLRYFLLLNSLLILVGDLFQNDTIEETGWLANADGCCRRFRVHRYLLQYFGFSYYKIWIVNKGVHAVIGTEKTGKPLRSPKANSSTSAATFWQNNTFTIQRLRMLKYHQSEQIDGLWGKWDSSWERTPLAFICTCPCGHLHTCTYIHNNDLGGIEILFKSFCPSSFNWSMSARS